MWPLEISRSNVSFVPYRPTNQAKVTWSSSWSEEMLWWRCVSWQLIIEWRWHSQCKHLGSIPTQPFILRYRFLTTRASHAATYVPTSLTRSLGSVATRLRWGGMATDSQCYNVQLHSNTHTVREFGTVCHEACEHLTSVTNI